MTDSLCGLCDTNEASIGIVAVIETETINAAICEPCYVFLDSDVGAVVDVLVDRRAKAFQCDFCTAVPATWRYPAKNFNYDIGGVAVARSLGPWVACDRCADLIESGKNGALVGVGVSVARKLFGTVSPEVTGFVRQYQALFRENRTTAEPVRIESAPQKESR